MFVERTRTRTVWFITLLLTVILIAISILVWSIWHSSQPKLPLYPRAQEVDIIDKFEASNNAGTVKITVYNISFWTHDTTRQVLTFYRDTLSQQGWKLEHSDDAIGVLVFMRQLDSSSPIMALTVSAGKSERPQMTHCSLTLGDYNDMQRIHALGI